MNNTIISTGYKLAQSVVANGQITGNPWQGPQNVLLSDGLFATSNPAESAASDFVVGNFALGIPADAVVTGFIVKILGKRGAQTVPPLTLTMSAVDNTNGPDVFYPYAAPYTGLTPNDEEHFLGGANYLFDTTWTATQANNIKLAFQANGDISLDSVSVNVLYYVPGAAPSPDPVPEGCEDCNSVIQVQKMTLKVAFKATDTEFIIAPGAFAYADGTPVQPGDLGSCGGEIDFVFDQGLRKPIDGNFAENVAFFSDTGSWVVLGDGSTKFTLGSFTDRGRQFHEPYGHDANLVSGHAANSEVVISNNGRFYSRFVRRCQEDTVFSPPIAVQDEGSDVVSALHTLNFRGPNVQAEQDPGDTHQVNVDILANPTNASPTVEDSNEGTTGTTPATSISIPLTIVAANYLRIWISSQDEAAPAVTFDGVPATIIGSETHGSADLKAFLFDLVSPNAGAHSVVITFANPINFSAGAVSFLDADITNPVDGLSAGTSGNGTAPTGALTTAVQNSLAQDVVAAMSNPTTFAQGALWTIQGQVNAAAYPGASSVRKVLIPGTVTDTYSILPTGDWVLLLAGVRGVAAPVPVAGIASINGDTTPAQVLSNADGLIAITQPVSGTNRFGIDLSNLVTALLGSASFIAGLVSNLISNLSFINGLTSNSTFQSNVNSFVSPGGSSPMFTPMASATFSGSFPQMQASAYDSAGKVIYTKGTLDGAFKKYAYDPVSGLYVPTPVTGSGYDPSDNAITHSPDGNVYAIQQVSSGGGNGVQINGYDQQIQPVSSETSAFFGGGFAVHSEAVFADASFWYYFTWNPAAPSFQVHKSPIGGPIDPGGGSSQTAQYGTTNKSPKSIWALDTGGTTAEFYVLFSDDSLVHFTMDGGSHTVSVLSTRQLVLPNFGDATGSLGSVDKYYCMYGAVPGTSVSLLVNYPNSGWYDNNGGVQQGKIAWWSSFLRVQAPTP